jgi:hypothetical protein
LRARAIVQTTKILATGQMRQIPVVRRIASIPGIGALQN